MTHAVNRFLQVALATPLTLTPMSAKALLIISEVGAVLVATLRVEPHPNLPPRPEMRGQGLGSTLSCLPI